MPVCVPLADGDVLPLGDGDAVRDAPTPPLPVGLHGVVCVPEGDGTAIGELVDDAEPLGVGVSVATGDAGAPISVAVAVAVPLIVAVRLRDVVRDCEPERVPLDVEEALPLPLGDGVVACGVVASGEDDDSVAAAEPVLDADMLAVVVRVVNVDAGVRVVVPVAVPAATPLRVAVPLRVPVPVREAVAGGAVGPADGDGVPE